MRARARREKFLDSLRLDKPLAGDTFESAQQLFSAGVPVTWKNREGLLGKIKIMKANGELTKEGQFIETQGWQRPKAGKPSEEQRAGVAPKRWASGIITRKEKDGK